MEMPGATNPVRTYFLLPSIRDTSIVSMPSTWLASRSTASAGSHPSQAHGRRLRLSEGMGHCRACSYQAALLETSWQRRACPAPSPASCSPETARPARSQLAPLSAHSINASLLSLHGGT